LIKSVLFQDGSGSLFISGKDEIQNNIDLFIGPLEASGAISLIIEPIDVINDNIDLIIPGPQPISGGLDIFLKVFDIPSISASSLLFLQGPFSISDDIFLYTQGPLLASGGLDLFVKVPSFAPQLGIENIDMVGEWNDPRGLVYVGDNKFILSDSEFGAINRSLYTVDTIGTVTKTSDLLISTKGLVFEDNNSHTLLAISPVNRGLWSIDKNTGNLTDLGILLKLTGQQQFESTVDKCNGLARDPTTGQLFGILRLFEFVLLFHQESFPLFDYQVQQL